mgnify:CR=1 FL=1
MTELEQLVNQIKQSTDYQTNKRILKEKIQTDLHIPYNNGLFNVTTDLIAFLNSWDCDELILEDVYENPIIINRLEFLTLCKQRYYKIMNTWYHQHERLKETRKI